MSTYPELKRLNFFTGFFTTADDWNEGQAYHLEKSKLHNRGLHKPGVIHDLEKESGKQLGLAVSAAGGLNVTVSPGAALDGEGNLICLATARTLELGLPDNLPRKVYLYIQFDDHGTDRSENIEDPDFSGFTRKTEEPIIDWTYEQPDNSKRIELASIELQVGVTEINGPDSDVTKPNRIKLDGVKKAGAVNVETDYSLAALQEKILKLHEYHLAKEQRHNCALHTPGLLRGVANELTVMPAGGLWVEVQTGAALDAAGHELYLDQPCRLGLTAPTAKSRVYIVATYKDHFMDYLSKTAKGIGASYRTLQLTTTTVLPDNQFYLELAHVDLEADATEVRLPADPGLPQSNELDAHDRVWAGSTGLISPRLPPDVQKRIVGLMQSTRAHFIELDGRFPVAVIDELRQAVLHLKLTVALIEPAQLPNLIKMIAGLELAVEHELGKQYPALIRKAEFKAYQEAVTHLLDALRQQQAIDSLLTAQAQVAHAAHSLSQVIFPLPIANAGLDQTWEIVGSEIKVLLDASGSSAGEPQKIVTYRWEKVI